MKEHSISFWDAMIWAAANEVGVTLLLSEDFQRDRVLEGMQFYNPFASDDSLVHIFGTTL